MYTYSVSEEVARWTLEVHLHVDETASQNWWIAFTNPTAGPWKRLMARVGQRDVEVYRYQRDEDRPDLIIVNDRLRLVLVVEAKDAYEKLLIDTQMKKSIAVIQDMQQRLGDLADNEGWGERAGYTYLPGFLWGQSKNANRESQEVAAKFFSSERIAASIPLVNFVVTQSKERLVVGIVLHDRYSKLGPKFVPSLNLPIL